MAVTPSFHAFLSYCSSDLPLVQTVAEALRQTHRLRLFFDRWCVSPGDLWQEALEGGLAASRAVVVFLGPSNITPWQNEELRAAVEARVRDPEIRLVPVLLPGAADGVVRQLPGFLARSQWLDMRGGISPAQIERLATALKGRKSANRALVTEVGNRRPGGFVLIAGPSGVGKDVILARLLHGLNLGGRPACLLRKYTTREPRSGELPFHPYEFLADSEFTGRLANGRIACVQSTYGYRYGIDPTFQEGIVPGSIVLVAMRAYELVAEAGALAAAHGMRTVAVLLTAPVSVLEHRILFRTTSPEEKNRRLTGMIYDTEWIVRHQPLIRTLFDLVLENSDATPLNATLNALFAGVLERLSEDAAHHDPPNKRLHLPVGAE